MGHREHQDPDAVADAPETGDPAQDSASSPGTKSSRTGGEQAAVNRENDPPA